MPQPPETIYAEIRCELVKIAEHVEQTMLQVFSHRREKLKHSARKIRDIAEFILELEIKIGIAAEAIGKLEIALTAERAGSNAKDAQITDLQKQLAALQAEPRLDADDQAAVAGVDQFLNPVVPAPVEAPATPAT